MGMVTLEEAEIVINGGLECDVGGRRHCDGGGGCKEFQGAVEGSRERTLVGFFGFGRGRGECDGLKWLHEEGSKKGWQETRGAVDGT